MKPKDPRARALPLKDWPKEDRLIWIAAKQNSPFSATGGEVSHLNATSKNRIQANYGRWLWFLKSSGRLKPNRKPGQFITEKLVKLYIHELVRRGNISSTIALKLYDLELMARLMKPDLDREFLTNHQRRLRKLRNKEHRKEYPIQGSHDLFALGQNLMASADKRDTPLETAVQFRDGLIIALLSLVPLRTSNFMQIKLDSELLKLGRKWSVHIAASATKTRHPIDFNWPTDLVGPLNQYLEFHRAFLAARRPVTRGRPVKRLWLSRDGDALGIAAFQHMVRIQTQKAFGTSMNPHSFRDAAATTLATHKPENLRLASLVLGHLSRATTERFYNQGASLDAQRRYSEVIGKYRRKS